MAAGWAYVSCSEGGTGGGQGPAGSVQFVTASDGGLSGSSYLSWSYDATGDGYDNRTLIMTGTLKVSGAISASTLVIEQTTIIDTTGSTRFGNSVDDTHVFTGSIQQSGSSNYFGVLGGPLSAPALFVSGGIQSGDIKGYVGVGTLAPDHELAVSGNISASANVSASAFYGDGASLTNLSVQGLFTEITNVAIYTTSSVVVSGSDPPSGALHIQAGDPGVSPGPNYSTLVVGDNTTTGISILGPDGNAHALIFGSPADNAAAGMTYVPSSNYLTLGNQRASGYTIITTANNTEALRLDTNQHLSAAADVSASANITAFGYIHARNAEISASSFWGKASGLTNIPAPTTNPYSILVSDGAGAGLIANNSSDALISATHFLMGMEGPVGGGDNHFISALTGTLMVSGSNTTGGGPSADLLNVVSFPSGTSVLFVTGVAGAYSSLPRVGINTDTPDHELAISGNVSASVNISASAFYGDGSQLSNVTTDPAGASTYIQYNDGGSSFGANAGLVYDGTGSMDLSGTTSGRQYSELGFGDGDRSIAARSYDMGGGNFVELLDITGDGAIVTLSSSVMLTFEGGANGAYFTDTDIFIEDLSENTQVSLSKAGQISGSSNLTLQGHVDAWGSGSFQGGLTASSLSINGESTVATKISCSNILSLYGKDSGGSGMINLYDGESAFGIFRSGSFSVDDALFEIWSAGLRNSISFNAAYAMGEQYTQFFLDADNQVARVSGSLKVFDGELITTGSLKLSGSFSTGYVRVTDVYYEVANRSRYDCVIGVSSSNTTAVEVMLPSASIGAGHRIIIKDEYWPGDGGTRAAQYAITASVTGGSGDLIDGLNDYEMYGSMPSVTLYSDGINKWFVI